MSLDSFEQALRSFDAITGAQSVVGDRHLEVAYGALPEGIASDDVPETESPTWSEVEGWLVLSRPLPGFEDRQSRIVSFFDEVGEAKRPAIETLQGLVGLAGNEPTRLSRDLREMRLMFQSVLDTIPVRVFWKDTKSVYQGSNRLFAQDAGEDSPDELVGKTDYDLSFGDEAELYRADDRKVMSSGRAKIDYEEPQTTPEGEQIWLQTSKIPLRDADHQTVGVLGTYRDITRRKNAEAEREALLAALESKNSELERFTYTVSHDLKSPLVTIQGFLGVLEKDLRGIDVTPSGVDARLFDSIARIRRASSKMSQLLDELLEMSRVGQILGPRRPVKLQALLDDAILLCTGALGESAAELEVQGDFPVVDVDGPRIVQVIQNLVENACKYRRPGQPLIIRVCAAADGSFFVEDNGIGIPVQYRERVFRLFEKLDPATEGSGIGLALVKRIVETHGGTVRIESAKKGSGARFRLALPLSVPE